MLQESQSIEFLSNSFTTNTVAKDRRTIIRIPRSLGQTSAKCRVDTLEPEGSGKMTEVAMERTNPPGPRIPHKTSEFVNIQQVNFESDLSTVAPLGISFGIEHSTNAAVTQVNNIGKVSSTQNIACPEKKANMTRADAHKEAIEAISKIDRDGSRDKGFWLGNVEYEPFKILFPNDPSLIGGFIQVFITAAQLVPKNNSALKNLALWGGGDGVYTDESDLVAILYHQGLLTDNSGGRGCKVAIQILPKEELYASVTKNGISSRSWKRHDGFSIRIISVEPLLATLRRCHRRKSYPRRSNEIEGRIIRTSRLTSDAILDFRELVLRPQDTLITLEKGVRLLLENETSQYIMSLTADGKIDFHASAGVTEFGSSVVPSRLAWESIRWLPNGVSIGDIALKLSCYRWMHP